jgi:hypothetical protein
MLPSCVVLRINLNESSTKTHGHWPFARSETLWVCGLELLPSRVSADVADLDDTFGESFHSSVAWMVLGKPPVVQRFVALVGNLLILRNDSSSLRTLMTQPENVAVEVLLYTIRASTVTDFGATNALRDDATKLLLSRLGDWSSVYEAMKQNPTLFNASNPLEVTYLLTNVALEQRVEDSMLPVVVDALVCVLVEQSGIPCGFSACVTSLVECLVLCEDAPASKKPQESSFGQFCDDLGPRWRKSILCTDALPLVLVSLSEMVLRYPSKLAPLSLLGAVIGNSSDYVTVDCNQDTLVSATKDMVKLALNGMSSRAAPCATFPNDQAIQKLSPLLLLRRIPRYYYTSLAGAQDVSQTKDLYAEVAKEVAIRIGIEVGNETCAESYTVDERRLAAEVAALLLPAEDLYRLVISPSYVSLTDALESPEACEASLVPKIRAFRTALYSGCHVIPFAERESDGKVLLKIASCSLSLLRCELPSTDRGECQEELHRLEAGCTEFLALCIQRLFEGDACDAVTTTSVSSSRSKWTCPALDALELLRESLTAIALTGMDDVVSNLVDMHEGERTTKQYSILARTCVWNSLLLVAKRCRVEHGHLQRFGAAFAQRAIAWGVSGPVDTSTRHPLCVAAAFQILLTLFVRSASSDWNVASPMDGRLLDQLTRWSFSVASSSSSSSSSSSNNSRMYSSAAREARMSAVKLLLGMLASGAVTADEPNRRVPGQRLLDILSLLSAIAEHDPDGELQKLAMASIQVLRSGDEAQLAGMPAS